MILPPPCQGFSAVCAFCMNHISLYLHLVQILEQSGISVFTKWKSEAFVKNHVGRSLVL